MSNVLQRLAQRGAAPAAATGLVPLQMRPRSRFDTATPDIETAEVAGASGLSAPVFGSSRPLFTRGETRPAPMPRAASREAPAMRGAALQALSGEPDAAIKAEPPPAPSRAPLSDAGRDPPPSVAAGRAEPSDPLAAVEQPDAPEPTRPLAEPPERSTPLADPFGAEAARAEPPAAEAPPSLSIGRLEVQFVQPPAPPAPVAPLRRGASGFADYARIRRGSPR